MSEINRLSQEEQDNAITRGLERFSTLPDWLASLRDHKRTYAVLSRDIPEIANAEIILKKSKIGHVQYRKGVWQNRCALEFRTLAAPEEKAIELKGVLYPPGSISTDRPIVRGEFGNDAWHAVLPELSLELTSLEPETELLAFDVLTDPDQARDFLERSIRSASPAYRNVQIRSCTLEIARYKPGDRCTILYRLDYEPEMPADHRPPPMVVAKTTKGEKGRTAFASLSALWNSSFGSSHLVRIAEPIAYDPALKVFVQGPVWEEQTLADLLLTVLDRQFPETLGKLSDAMQKTAQGLAELHQSGVRMGQVVSWADEMAEIEAELFPLCDVFPDISTDAAPFLNWIRQLEAATPPDTFVSSHGTFRPVQVLLHQNELSFIDFDSFCQSEPARDLAMFLTSML